VFCVCEVLTFLPPTCVDAKLMHDVIMGSSVLGSRATELDARLLDSYL
jgi:hypothetical protein